MEWMASVGEIWLTTLKWLAGLGAAFFVLTRLTPCNPGMYWWKNLRAAATDALYWLLVPLFLRLCRTLMLIAGVALLFGGQEVQILPVLGLPLWQQCLIVLLLQDVLLYGMHRAFHTGWAWKFHAVHHSPRDLDWVSTQRFHPINQLLTFTLADVAVLLLGFSPETLLILAPFNIVYSTMVHANLNWTFGPLRYLFASPVFHRWHHTSEKEGLDKNFASTFPFLDLMFGTFYMPPGKVPEHFGTGEPDFPEDFLGQFLHPFRKTGEAGQAAGGRPVIVVLKAASLLAVVGLLGVGSYLLAGLVDRNEKLAEDLVKVEASVGAMQLDVAARAWADNDLSLATAVLNQVACSFKETPEYRRLRDLCEQKCKKLTGHKGAVLCVAVSGDGRHVLSGGADGTIKIWDAATGREEQALVGHRGYVQSVAVSGDGRHIVSGSADKTVKVWDAETCREERTLTGHLAPVLSVAVSGDGKCVVSGSADLSAKVWDAAAGKEKHTLAGDPGAVVGVAVSGDGRHVVTASAWTAKVWDADTGHEERTLAGHADLVYGVAIGADGHQVVTASFDEKVKVWGAAEGREKLSLMGHKGPVYSAALSPDGRCVVSGSNDRTVRVWDTTRGRELLTLKGHTDAVTGVAISPDGRRVIAGGRDGTITVWDIPSCAGR
jgi:WD40 repeat protein/sterol desaturase/sphingolipid hydroxylase (fatty acid hydroxylase superfamily)